MKPKTIYLPLCILGGEHGMNLTLLVRDLFANRVGGESSRFRMRNRWIPAVAVLLVGVSFGLPMFLYMREKKLQQV
jgi:hypothetical protein